MFAGEEAVVVVIKIVLWDHSRCAAGKVLAHEMVTVG